MRTTILIVLGLLLTGSFTRADEQFSTLTVSGEVYSNVTVTSVTATDIYFIHANGIGSAKLKDLDSALQQHFHYDAARAKSAAQQTGSAGNPPDYSDPQATLDDAMARVRHIVNQPVTELGITPDMQVSVYQPGWFHPGAITPDFNNVDIRATQDCNYGAHQYCTSDINPGICFLGSELEFNSMTKYFYTDRSLPKKKLTQAEMVEINRLYRVIGTCQDKLSAPGSVASNPGQPQGGAASSNSALGFLAVHKAALISGAAGLLFLIMLVLNIRKGHAEA